MTAVPSQPNVSSAFADTSALYGAVGEETPVPATESRAAPSDSRAARTWLRAEAAAGRAPLVGATLAGLGGTVAILVRAYAFASIIALGALRHESLAQLEPWLALFGAAVLVKAVCGYLVERCGAAGAWAIQRQVRRRLLTALLAPERMIADTFAPRAAAHAQAMMEQVDRLEPYYARYLPQAVLAVLTPILFLLVIFPQSWVVGLLLLCSTPVIPAYMALIGMDAEARSRRQGRTLRALSTYFLDRLQGLATLTSLGAAEREVRRVEAASDSLRRRSMDVLKVALLSSAVLEFFSTFAVALVALYIGLTLLGYLRLGVGPTGMSLRTAFFLLLLAPTYFQPLRAFAAAYHDRADALAATEHLLPVLTPEPTTSASGGPSHSPATTSEDRGDTLRPDSQHATPAESHVLSTPLPPARPTRRLALQNVTVRFAGQQDPALAGVSLSIERGQMVGITGPSGAGKSTLLGVLGGLVHPTVGALLVDDTLVGTEYTDWMRDACCWLGQRPYLFPGTLAENIAFARADAPRAALEEAAKRARVASFTERRPEGLEVRLGERGQGLSGGEAQRVALARAFLQDAPLLLLDEPTAHLDPTTEQEVLDVLAALAVGRTVVIATHSPRVLARCDRVVVLENGRMVSDQPHPADPTRDASPSALQAAEPVWHDEALPQRDEENQHEDPVEQAPLGTDDQPAPQTEAMRDLLPVLRLFWAPQSGLRSQLLLGLGLACLALCALIGLLGLAGWFVVMATLAGLLAVTAFSFVFPSAGVQALAVGRTAARYGERVVLHETTFHWLARLRVHFFTRALRLPAAALTAFASGDLLGRVVADIDALDQLPLRVLVPTLSAGVVTVLALLFLATQSLGVALFVALLALAAGLGLPALAALLGRRAGATFVEARAALRAHLVEALEGGREIVAYRAERRVAGQLTRHLEEVEQAQRALRRLRAAGVASGTLLTGVAVLGTLALDLARPGTSVFYGALTPPLSAASLAMVSLIVLGLFEALEGAARGVPVARSPAAGGAAAERDLWCRRRGAVRAVRRHGHVTPVRRRAVVPAPGELPLPWSAERRAARRQLRRGGGRTRGGPWALRQRQIDAAAAARARARAGMRAESAWARSLWPSAHPLPSGSMSATLPRRATSSMARCARTSC